MILRPPRSTPLYSSAASDVYKRQVPAPQRRDHAGERPRGVCAPRVYGAYLDRRARAVHGEQAEAGVERAPLVVVDHGPVEVPDYRNAVLHRSHRLEDVRLKERVRGRGITALLDTPPVDLVAHPVLDDEDRQAARVDRLRFPETVCLL